MSWLERRSVVLVLALVAGSWALLLGCALPEEEAGSTGSAPLPVEPDPAAESAGETAESADEAVEPGPNSGNGSSVEVLRLSDGDSGLFLVDGEEIEVRLLGYNAPERYENDAATEPGCNGQVAEAALAELLAASQNTELEGSEIDRFGRTLADLDLDGASAVSTLILGGYGLALGDGPDRALMKEAAAAGRGIWGDQCGRPAAQGIVVDRVEPNPAGRDEENLNGEWVELYNDGDSAIDLTGWDIRDDSSSNRFSLGGRLAPGDSVIVRTGSGQSGGGDYYLGSDSPVWSNRTDTVLVIDPAGVVAAWAFIDG
jgi:endonuclease YncB( thermonuclease family)